MRVGKLSSYNMSKETISTSTAVVEEKKVQQQRLHRLKERLKSQTSAMQVEDDDRLQAQQEQKAADSTNESQQGEAEESKLQALSNNRRVNVSFFAESDGEDEEDVD